MRLTLKARLYHAWSALTCKENHIKGLKAFQAGYDCAMSDAKLGQRRSFFKPPAYASTDELYNLLFDIARKGKTREVREAAAAAYNYLVRD